MRGFEQEQTKQLLLNAMEDIKKFEKYSQEDQTRINDLKVKIGKQDQKIAVPLEEIKAHKKLSKILSEDQMAREVTKRKLGMQEKQSSKKRRYKALTKVRAMRQVDFQESEEEEQCNSGESSGEEELMRRIVKHKNKTRKTAKGK